MALEDMMDTVRYFNDRPVYLDRQGQPMTLRQWSEAFADGEGRTLAQTKVGRREVLTMWMGVDADPISNPVPLIFGTAVLGRRRRITHEIETPTEEAALKAHYDMVAKLEAEDSA